MENEKIEVNEIFTSIQGEGIYTGYPSTFIRLVGCNLRCVFAGGSICDSAYTSHRPEPPRYRTVKEVVEECIRQQKELGLLPNTDIGKNNDKMIRHFVITGGEPMRQQKGIATLIEELRSTLYELYDIYPYEPVFTVETNGTYKLDERYLQKNDIDLFSVSPKLSTSEYFDLVEDNPEKRIPKKAQERHVRDRINYPAIGSYIGTTGLENLKNNRIQLKFVYSNKGNEEEIKQWLEGLVEYLWGTMYTEVCSSKEEVRKLVNGMVRIMPEGETVEQITQKAQELADICIKNGWKFTDRLHIRIWGDKRAV